MTWLLLIPLIIILPFCGAFLILPGADFTDLLISHYPNALFLHNSLFHDGVLPLWSDRILSGFPFAANPLSGLWYPFGWLAVIYPSALAFNLTAGLHCVWGGIGMYRWMRSENLSPRAALTAGLAFELMPKVWAHEAAGHISLVYAVMWTPWLLLAARRAVWKESIHLWQGLVLAMVILADIRWGAVAGLLWLAYVMVGVQTPKGKSAVAEKGQSEGRPESLHPRWTRKLTMAGINMVVAGLASAVLTLPLVEYTSLSTRSLITPREASILSLPPARILGLFFPEGGGSAEWVAYPLQAVLVLAVLAISIKATRSRNIFWMVCAGISLILSIGANLPGWELVAGILPIANLLRVPPRLLIITVFSLIVLAAAGLDAVMVTPGLAKTRSASLAAAGVVEVTFLVWIVSTILIGKSNTTILLGAAASLIVFSLLVLNSRGRINSTWLWAGVMVIIILDGSLFALMSFRTIPSRTALADGSEAAGYIASQEGMVRVYSPSYSIPAQTSASFGLEMVDGVDPLQLTAYSKYMAKASGVPITGYSVTLPEFPQGNPKEDNRESSPDSALLGILNTAYIVSAYDLASPGLVIEKQFGDTRIYRNVEVQPRAWMETENKTVNSAIPTVTGRNANEVQIISYGPGRLVLSEIMYPGWKVEVDGKPGQDVSYNGLLRAVDLPAGKHTVRWYFQPLSVYLGLAVSGLGWLVCLAYEFTRRRSA